MSDFEHDLVTLCMTECVKARGDSDASTHATNVIANTLASSIALLMDGHEGGAVAVARIIAAELPALASQRAASFRETFGGPSHGGRPN